MRRIIATILTLSLVVVIHFGRYKVTVYKPDGKILKIYIAKQRPEVGRRAVIFNDAKTGKTVQIVGDLIVIESQNR